MAIPLSHSVILTGDSRIDGLLQSSIWDTHTLTYNTTNTEYGSWSVADKTQIQQAFDAFSNVSNLTFTVSENPDINFKQAGYSQSVVASSGFPDYTISFIPGRILINNYDTVFSGGASSEGRTILLHEIGHALGLKHPHDNGGYDSQPTYSELYLSGADTQANTIMSYNRVDTANEYAGNPITLMPNDILAIQYLYGVNTNYASGNTTWKLGASDEVKTIWDGGGHDILDFGSYAIGSKISLKEGEFSFLNGGSSAQTAIAYNTIIEDADVATV